MIVKVGGKVVMENPFVKAANGIENISKKLDAAAYWINPVHWFQALWTALDHAIRSGSLDDPLIIGTMIGVILVLFGAKWPKKVVFWAWIVFWILRAFVFA